MRARLLALPAGFLLALLVSGLPAATSDQQVAAQASNTWQPATVQIDAGDSVTWSNAVGGFHNVCVVEQGGTICVFRNGDVGSDWSSHTNSHRFATPGTYTYFCEFHGNANGTGMAGTLTVEGGGTGTTNTDTITDTTTTTTPTQTSPTQTQTTPTDTTPTQTTQAESDTSAPAFQGRVTRRSSRRALVLRLSSSEDAELEVTVFRRAPRARRFSRVGQATLDVDAGRNTVRVPRRTAGRLRRGAYRVKLVLVDAAGNRSALRTLKFMLG